MADRLLAALRPFTSPLGARICPPGRGSWSGRDTDGLEGFARALLLASFRLADLGTASAAGCAGSDLLRDSVVAAERLAERFAAGLLAGTDRGGPEAWPPITDGSQEIAEAAGIAVALHESRSWIWDRLGSAGRDQVTGWLCGVVGRCPRDNNHLLFQVVTEEFLASVGAEHDRAEIEAGLDRVEGWYTGDGWYLDGPQTRCDYRLDAPGEFATGLAAAYDAGRRFDHYNAWGLHLYPLLWARVAGSSGQDRAEEYRLRLRAFLGQYAQLFGSDGAPLHYGRSLSYRFACLAPFWLGALHDATPLSPGQTRRLASGVLRHFAERGVPDPRGLLSLGWYGRFEPAAQAYSSPGSPYAAALGFLGLLLPACHVVWTTPEERLEGEVSDASTPLHAPGWLVHRTAADGVVRVLNHGSCYLTAPPARERDDPHYAKFAYATCTAPQTGDEASLRLDNHLALLPPGGAATRRERIHPLGLTDRYVASWHRPLMPGGADGPQLRPVVSVSVLCGGWEVRVHGVRLPTGWAVREGGYAPAADGSPGAVTGEVTRHPAAVVRTAHGLVCAMVGLRGWAKADVRFSTGANAFGRHSAVPYLCCPAPGFGDLASDQQPPDVWTVLVSAVLLSSRPVGPEAVHAIAGLGVRVAGEEVVLELPGQPELVVHPVLPWREPVVQTG